MSYSVLKRHIIEQDTCIASLYWIHQIPKDQFPWSYNISFPIVLTQVLILRPQCIGNVELCTVCPNMVSY